ncbi:MAG TPA: PTS sugar transporter subunit IIA [Candidatus Saccharicenans sp.]|nr:PTS sugar transporter subunit IIA [Candidatus Saccharicenans sp.]
MRLSNIINDKTILLDIKAKSKAEALREMVNYLKKNKLISRPEEVIDKLEQRESLGTTALGEGLALPHCKVKWVNNPIVLVGLARQGVPFDAPDGCPVNIFFLLITSLEDPSLNLQILALIAQLIKKSPELKEKLLQAKSPAEVREIIKRQEEQYIE